MEMSKEVVITFIGYLAIMLLIGTVFSLKIRSVGEFLLGGRKLGSWVTALSAQASDMSGWLLMGVPGAVYMAGLGETWIAIGLAVGTLLNWIFVAPRLRIYTEKTDSLTLSTFFANRFRDPSSMLRVISALVILTFFTIYASSGLVAAGKLFEGMFKVEYKKAVLIGAGVILFYTILGGYLAVCWTDLVQGLLMFVALVAVPVVAYFGIDGATGIANAFEMREMTFSLFPDGVNKVAILAAISAAVWGLGYFGQPHILSRFMSVSDIRQLPRATVIAMIWVVISLAMAVFIGVTAVALYGNLGEKESEMVFIYMIRDLFNPYVGGVLLAALLAAIMSTIDSQLLVSSSALTEDFYRKVLRREAGTKELVWISRGFVLFITMIATVIALFPVQTIFKIVEFAWGGFGAAFGPVVLMAIYSRKTTWKSALAGMIAGTAVMLLWKFTGMSKYMYEILPGFAVGWITIFIWNFVEPQKDPVILEEYDDMLVALDLRKKSKAESCQ